MISIEVNGERVTLNEPSTVAELLAARNLSRTPCAVEVNCRVIPRREHDEVRLSEGDQVEIVTLVGGG